MDFSSVDNQLNYCYIDKKNNLINYSTKTAFYLFSIFPYNKIVSNQFIFPVNFGVNKGKSNIFFIVCKNQELNIWDEKEKKILNTISYEDKITDILLSTTYFILVFTNSIIIYDYQLKERKKIPFLDNQSKYFLQNDILYYIFENILYSFNISKSETTKIYENINTDYFIVNHTNELIAFSTKKGTIINLLCMNTNKITKQFWRGYDGVTILNMDFDNKMNYLLATNNKGTIHVFEINSVANYMNFFIYSKFKFYIKKKYFYSSFVDDNIVIIDDDNIYLLNITDDIRIQQVYKLKNEQNDFYNSSKNLIT